MAVVPLLCQPTTPEFVLALLLLVLAIGRKTEPNGRNHILEGARRDPDDSRSKSATKTLKPMLYCRVPCSRAPERTSNARRLQGLPHTKPPGSRENRYRYTVSFPTIYLYELVLGVSPSRRFLYDPKLWATAHVFGLLFSL